MLFFGKASIFWLYYRAFNSVKWLSMRVYISVVLLFIAYWMTSACADRFV